MNWNQHMLWLRRAWAEIQPELMPALFVSLGFGLVALLPFWPWYFLAVLVIGTAAPLAWMYYRLLTHALGHPHLRDSVVVPLEPLREGVSDPLVDGSPTPQEPAEVVRWEGTGNQ